MHLADLFDAIYIIHLGTREDRRKEMSAELRRIGWDPAGPRLTWFPAIDPKSAAGFSTPGARGCFLSHAAVLNLARSSGGRRVLVLEDDCDFAPDFRDREAEVAGRLESTPWEIAYIGHVEDVSGPPGLVTWDPAGNIRLTHCYAITGEALSGLPAYLEALTVGKPGSADGGPMSIDAGFSWYRRDNPGVRTVLVSPSLAHQRPSRSDLSPRWFDRVPVLRDAAGMMRSRRRTAGQA
ncbi:MAG: glycosyltransferase family 25 protein [Isosphaeraceae bacterium]